MFRVSGQEGRIDESGCLQCSYHGWSFDGSGACSRIPQAASEGPEARAVRSPRACAIKFPTLVSQGLLFVWPDEKGWEKATATQPPMYVCLQNRFDCHVPELQYVNWFYFGLGCQQNLMIQISPP